MTLHIDLNPTPQSGPRSVGLLTSSTRRAPRNRRPAPRSDLLIAVVPYVFARAVEQLTDTWD
jgi:hypothetical protein